MFCGVMSLAVALPVIPAKSAIVPTMPFENAPEILSSIGRTASVTASLRLPFFNCPYSMESVKERTVTSCANVKLNKTRPMMIKTRLLRPKMKSRYEAIIESCPIANSVLRGMNLFRIG